MTPTSSTDYTHVIIPENAASIAEGRGNVLEQGAINNDNTVYHIVHDFVLEGATINVPRNFRK